MKTVFALFIVCCLALLVLEADAQIALRSIDHDRHKLNNEPIEIVRQEIGNRAYTKADKMEAGPDWLRSLTLTVKNNSQKAIVRFEIMLVIDRQAPLSTIYALNLYFPQPPVPILDDRGKPTGEFMPFEPLKPGEITKVKVVDPDLRILDRLKSEAVSVTNVAVSIRAVYYDDRTRWRLGHEGRPDPNDQDRWIPIKPKPSRL